MPVKSRNKRVRFIVDSLLFAFYFFFFYGKYADTVTLILFKLTHRVWIAHFWLALLLSIFLFGIQRFIRTKTNYPPDMYAMTHVPSISILILLSLYPLSSVPIFGLLLTAVVVVFFLFTFKKGFGVASTSRRMPVRRTRYAFNYLIVAYLLTCVLCSANTNDVLFYELRLQTLLIEGRYAQAASVGQKSLATSSLLNSLRAYALNRRGLLAEDLLDYPQPSGEITLLPDADDAKRMFFPISRLDSLKQSKDYALCLLLLNKKLNAFVRQLPQYYAVDDAKSLHALPTLYKQALLLYGRQQINPEIVYKDDIMNANYDDFVQTVQTEKTLTAGINRSRFLYGNTYWWYFKYKK